MAKPATPSARTVLRQQAGFSSADAAAVVGVRAARYLAWERGGRRLKTRESERLVRAVHGRVNGTFWIPRTRIRLSLVLNDVGIPLLDWLSRLEREEQCPGCRRMYYEN